MKTIEIDERDYEAVQMLIATRSAARLKPQKIDAFSDKLDNLIEEGIKQIGVDEVKRIFRAYSRQIRPLREVEDEQDQELSF